MRLVNYLLLSLCLIVGAITLLLRSPDVDVPAIPKKHARKKEMCELGELGPFELAFALPTLQLPHLEEELIFYGYDGRPDGGKALHFGIRGSDQTVAIKECAYLAFDRERCCYEWSKTPTNLWIELVSDEGALCTCMEDEASEPFTLPKRERPYVSWELDGMRVDSSLLARQRAKWYGQDLFLVEHGGEEFLEAKERERIDFGEYCCFVGEGEGLSWKDGLWQRLEATEGYPLLFVKKVDDQLLTCELWDAEGKSKTELSMMRSKALFPPAPRTLQFVAAKTWTQFVLDAGDQRLEVGPGDWLLLEEGCWNKLEDPEAIDDYVAMRRLGDLLVVEGLARVDGRRVLVGHLFNQVRTAVEPIEIPLTTTPIASVPRSTGSAAKRPFIPLPEATKELAIK